MSKIKPWLYFIIAIYTLVMLMLSIFFNDENLIYRLFDSHSSKGFLFGINTFLRSVFLILSATFFFISYLIVKNKKEAEKEQYFYLSQIVIFIFLTFIIRFQIHQYLFFIQKWMLMSIIICLEAFCLFFLGDFRNLKSTLKQKIYTALGLLLITYISNRFMENGQLKDGFIGLSYLWIDLMIMMFAWRIMYSKISKLKRIANKYYYENKEVF